MENLAAIIFALGVGTALLILPIDKAEEALVGNINNISLIETIIVVLISIIVFYITKRIYPKVMMLNIHEELARVEGINVDLYNFLYLLNIGLVVSIGVYLVGGLITAALIAIPSAIAKNLSRNLKSYQLLAVISGISSTITGIYLNQFYHLPTGPLIIVTGAIFFILSVVIKSIKKFNF
jgi:ABC-type Mn2+/Zn2+ transport systems, permease components